MHPAQPLPADVLQAVGSPAFVLDLPAAVTAAGMLTSELAAHDLPYHCWYAVKCNPHPELIAALHHAGIGFEVASVAELHSVIAAGANPADIPYTNPIRTSGDSAAALTLGVRVFTVDSHGEIDRLAAAADQAGVPRRDVQAVVRLAVPGVHATWDLSGKFGTSDPDTITGQVRAAGMTVHGFSFHVGSQTLTPAAWSTAADLAADAVNRSRKAGDNPRLLDVGGGFPVSYTDPCTDADRGHAADIVAEIARAWKAHAGTFTGMRLAVEPGRFIAAPAGRYVTTVIGVAERGEETWVFTDVGSYNGPSESRDSGGAIRLPVLARTSHQGTGTSQDVVLTGPTCDSADVLARHLTLPDGIHDGDLLEFVYAGAYSVAVASAFNGFTLPPVWVAHLDGTVTRSGN